MMPDIIEYAEKHKDEVMNALKKLEESGGDAMKSNKVRMNISREMHEWFTAIDGKTNDDKMVKLKAYKLKADTLESLYVARGNALLATSKMGLDYQDKLYKSRDNNCILKGLLGLSMTVSIISVSYLAYAQGWFL